MDVSIRARPRGLQLVWWGWTLLVTMFQFAPAHAGCNITCVGETPAGNCFNSRPRTRAATMLGSATGSDSLSFNSRPRTRAATRGLVATANGNVVSIRARARGLQLESPDVNPATVGFQFAPAHAGCNTRSGS